MNRSTGFIHRKIDFVADKEYVLERHCRINFECETPWVRKNGYDAYRNEWFSMRSQVDGFYEYMRNTASDERTIAEIIEDKNGDTIGYLWVPFYVIGESGFCFAEVKDIYIEEPYRKLGIATKLLAYAEETAIANNANAIRSGTGGENGKSIGLHSKLGYHCVRYEFEKSLK